MLKYHPFKGQKPAKQRMREALRNFKNLFATSRFYFFGNPIKDPMLVLQNYLDVKKGRATLSLLHLDEESAEVTHRLKWPLCMAIELIDNPFINGKWEQKIHDIIELLEQIVECNDPLTVEEARNKLDVLKKLSLETTRN